jgi:hypothetical protein
MRRYIAFVALLILGGLLVWEFSQDRSSQQKPATSFLAREADSNDEVDSSQIASQRDGQDRQPASVPASGGGAGSGAGGGAGSGSNSGRDPLANLLQKYSGTDRWTIKRDVDGRPFRMTGSVLKEVIANADRAQSFLSELQTVLGFDQPAILERKADRTGHFALVDYSQFYALPDGSKLPVFDGWIRFKGREEEGAILVTNHLRPVSQHLRAEVIFDATEVLSTARAHVTSPEAKLQLKHDVIFANSEPHQRATLVHVQEGPKERMLLIGHQTKSVIADITATLH